MEFYIELQKKYNLPVLEDLEKEFEVELDSPISVLKKIRKRIVEHLENYRDILHYILNPDNHSIIDLHECKFFEEKKNIYTLFKKMMVLHRKSLYCDLIGNEEAEAEFIKKSFEEWKNLKIELLPIVKKLEEAWHSDQSQQEELNYLG